MYLIHSIKYCSEYLSLSQEQPDDSANAANNRQGPGHYVPFHAQKVDVAQDHISDGRVLVVAFSLFYAVSSGAVPTRIS